MVQSTHMWIIFWTIITIALSADLIIFSKCQLSNKKLFRLSFMWISLAMIFAVMVFYNMGRSSAYEFLTGYLIEYVLSVDNLFVFITIFACFGIVGPSQQKALSFGIIGAIIMRFIFIFCGIKLIMLFDWIFLVFGSILVYTGFRTLKMLVKKQRNNSEKYNKLIAFLSKILPIKPDADTAKLFIRNNKKLYLTRTMLAIIAIELCDFTFAIDSIPAVLSITQNELIVYSSNIFAIIGLRSLYFVLHHLTTQFFYLKYGIAIILMFIGTKMMLTEIYPITTTFSLLFIVSAIALAVIFSQIKKRPTNILDAV